MRHWDVAPIMTQTPKPTWAASRRRRNLVEYMNSNSGCQKYAIRWFSHLLESVLYVRFLYVFRDRQPSCMIEARYYLSFRLHELAIIAVRR